MPNKKPGELLEQLPGPFYVRDLQAGNATDSC